MPFKKYNDKNKATKKYITKFITIQFEHSRVRYIIRFLGVGNK